MSASERNERAMHMLERVDMAHRTEHFPSQ